MPVLDNEQHELFCQHYATSMDGQQSAIEAKYSKKNARFQASQLLARPDIKARVAEILAPKAAALGATADRVVEEITRIGTADIGQLYDENGTLLPIHQLPEDIRRAIASIEVVEEFDGSGRDRVQIGWTKKIKFWDKNKALENLGRFHKLFTDVVEHKGLEQLSERLKASRERSRNK